ncbi:MAG: FAD-dependent oxidoreductase [Spirochaetales bacterium]|nr:FAD-dependent oxidoreductase [Spirochaetales bacterium]
MKKTDVLIIGGSASGIVTAITGKTQYPDKEFLIVRKEKHVLVPCGIPYIFGSLGDSNLNLISDDPLKNLGVKIMVAEVVSIDYTKKICTTAADEEIGFEKLVIATGSSPRITDKIKGTDLENVFTVPKNKVYIDKILEKIQTAQKIVIIGGGFIGIELSDELHKKGKEVTIVELLPHLLDTVFDEEMSVKVEQTLAERGIQVKTGMAVDEITGESSVSGVTLQNGEIIPADVVFLCIGYKPNTELAHKSGIVLNTSGFIKVDEYMRTDKQDIFAVGDCAENRDFITRKIITPMLASTACAEARTVGLNLYKLSTVKTFNGTISIFSTVIGDTCFAVAGITEKSALKEDFDIVTATFTGMDKHPGKLPGMQAQTVKLIVSKDSGVILGAGICGGASIGELINVTGLAIQNRMTVNSLLTTQIGTHPLLTGPPTAYPLIKASEAVIKKIRKQAKL